MEKCNISLTAKSSGQDLHLHVTLDGETLWQGFPSADPVRITHDFDDSTESDHVLGFELSGKTQLHTRINDQGEILEDAMITISSVSLDGIDLGQVFFENCTYCHDFNGTGAFTQDSFFGDMGCNGRVEMRFRSPSYLWLLESM